MPPWTSAASSAKSSRSSRYRLDRAWNRVRRRAETGSRKLKSLPTYAGQEARREAPISGGDFNGAHNLRRSLRVAGAGRLLGGGAVSNRGAVYFESESEKWKRLNTIAVVFEYEADADGNTKSKAWEWR
jgi:hypothetical protein